jgi:uncharacterized protein (TIGR04255 family)
MGGCHQRTADEIRKMMTKLLCSDTNEAAMSEPEFKLPNPPIVEAVLDIDYDMRPGLKVAELEPAVRERFKDGYPKFRTQFLQEHEIKATPNAPPKMSVRHEVQALQCLKEDEKQLVQVRAQGYSFNRLAPYSSLDDYLPEIEQTWRQFVEIAAPVKIRAVRLRYINRILVPLQNGKVELNDYLKTGPRLPDEDNMTFLGFLIQNAAVENATQHQVNTVLTSQGRVGEKLAIIFDNCVTSVVPAAPDDWAWILGKIHALRVLKNQVFRNSLTEKCLSLFQH